MPNATLTINLTALVRNYRLYQTWADGAAVACVVKADAYGLGMEAVANALYTAGCRTFFVAYPQEGVALRQTLQDADIIVLNGLTLDTLTDFKLHQLTPVLNTLAQVALWRDEGTSALSPWLQIETGMHRIGISHYDWELARDMLDFPNAGAMSHLACADTPASPMNRQQLHTLQQAKSFFKADKSSLAASSGVFLGADYCADMVRIGAGLYGAIPHPALQSVVSVHAPVLEIRGIAVHDHVGYGATYTASQVRKIATVGIGYADGYHRHLSNAGHVVLHGQRLPVVGRVSMDMITVDVSDITCTVGDMVEIYGATYTINDAATAAGTIGYEIITSLGKRLRRVYTARI